MPFYGAMLDLQDRLVLLVGGGQVAGRKLMTLLAAGARVRLVAPDLSPRAKALADDPAVEYLPRPYRPGDAEGAWLVVCATDDTATNQAVAAEAEQRRIFVNVVDVPPLCSFIVPAVIKRGDLTVAVSTGGASPAAAAALRRDLEAHLGPEWGPYLKLMARVRKKVLARDLGGEANMKLFKNLAASPLLGAVAAGDAGRVEAVLAERLGAGFGLAELGLAPGDLQPEGQTP